MIGFDLMLHWDEAANIVRQLGWDGWLRYVSAQFPFHDLYSTSQDWFTHGPQFIAKLRGLRGDVIVDWYEGKWR